MSAEALSIIVPTRLIGKFPQNAKLLSSKYDVHVVGGDVKPIGKARNVGAKKSHGGLLVFLDDDVGVCEDFLDLIVELARNGWVVSVGGTHCLAIRRDVFERVWFDDWLGWFEDYDFYLRAKKLGGPFMFLDYKRYVDHYGECRWNRSLKSWRIKSQFWMTQIVLRHKFFKQYWAKPEVSSKKTSYKRFFFVKNPVFLLVRGVGFFAHVIMRLRRKM